MLPLNKRTQVTRQPHSLVGITLTFRVPGATGALNVEVLFVMTDLSAALEYADDLKVDDLASVNALALRNTSADRETAYLGRIAADAVVILGTAGVRAAAGIDFPMPVIIVNSTEATDAAGAVIRVFDAAADAAGAPNLTSVSDTAGFTLPATALTPGTRTSFECRGVSDTDLVNRILTAVKR